MQTFDEPLPDLEQILTQDRSGEQTRALIARYAAAAAPLQARLREPQPREEYGPLEAMCRALQTAQEVLETAWTKQHSNKKLR
jgi:uncharacterized protein YifE (UPF0438 family)